MLKFKLTLIIFALTLAGCSMQPKSSHSTLAKSKRLQYLQQMQNWQASGRIAINNGTENVTASFTWEQKQQQYKIRFYSPFSTESVTIIGDDKDFKVISANGEANEELELEQQLPFTHMALWIKGMAAAQPAPQVLNYDAINQIKTLQQDGWLIEYQTYTPSKPVSLPQRLTITDGHTKAKLVIKNWK